MPRNTYSLFRRENRIDVFLLIRRARRRSVIGCQYSIIGDVRPASDILPYERCLPTVFHVPTRIIVISTISSYVDGSVFQTIGSLNVSLRSPRNISSIMIPPTVRTRHEFSIIDLSRATRAALLTLATFAIEFVTKTLLTKTKKVFHEFFYNQ